MEAYDIYHEVVEHLHSIQASGVWLSEAQVHEGETVQDEHQLCLEVLVVHDNDQDKEYPS